VLDRSESGRRDIGALSPEKLTAGLFGTPPGLLQRRVDEFSARVCFIDAVFVY